MIRHTVKCQIGDRKFDRYINGTLLNSEQEFEVRLNSDKDAERLGMRSVTPVKSVDVTWTDNFGDVHRSHYFDSAAYAAPAEFVREYR